MKQERPEDSMDSVTQRQAELFSCKKEAGFI
jgi:hypothetical protein